METSTETTRLQQVYSQYAARGLGHSKWSSANKGNQAIRAERDLRTRQLLEKGGFLPLAEQSILDVGCGTGEQLGRFLSWGAKPENLFGVDLIPSRIRTAHQLFPQITFETLNAESLPFANGAFDLVAVFTVLTSILNRQMAVNVAAEISRVLARDGAVLWYDFRINNPFNKHVRGLSRKQIQGLFPGFDMDLESISLLPPLARRLGPMTPWLYRPLSALPFLRTHLLGLLAKN